MFLNPKKGEKGHVSLDIHQFGSLNLNFIKTRAENLLEILTQCEKLLYDHAKFHRERPKFHDSRAGTQPEPVKGFLHTVKPLKTNLVYKKAF